MNLFVCLHLFDLLCTFGQVHLDIVSHGLGGLFSRSPMAIINGSIVEIVGFALLFFILVFFSTYQTILLIHHRNRVLVFGLLGSVALF